MNSRPRRSLLAGHQGQVIDYIAAQGSVAPVVDGRLQTAD